MMGRAGSGRRAALPADMQSRVGVHPSMSKSFVSKDSLDSITEDAHTAQEEHPQVTFLQNKINDASAYR
jgi:hypothetical protein